MESNLPNWKHPGGKLRERGAEALSEAELLAILISTGIPGRSAEVIANDVLREYGSLKKLSGRPVEELLRFKGLSDVKIIRIAAAMEIARRFGSR
jgi:DNA repair protein RadC